MADPATDASPDTSTDTDDHFKRVCTSLKRSVDPKTTLKIHKLLNRGCDQHRWGTNKDKIDRRTGEYFTRKAAWMAYAATYTRQERDRRAGKHARQYNRQRRQEHLSGQSTDFFCGKPPSLGGDYQFAIIDGDNRNDDQFPAVDKIITSVFPELHPEASTGGHGTHRLFKVAYGGRWGERDDQAMHDRIIAWSARLKTATAKIAGTPEPSFAEIKGACCYWDRDRLDQDGFRGTLVMGTLARCPVTLTPEQIESLPVYSRSDFESRLRKLETLAGLPQPLPNARTQPKPKKTPRRASGRASQQSTPAVRYTPDSYGPTHGQPTPDQEPDAFRRMVKNYHAYVRAHHEQPTADQLHDFYSDGPSANGEGGPERRRRAQTVAGFFSARPTGSSVPRSFSGTPNTEAPTETPRIDLLVYADTFAELTAAERSIDKSGTQKRRRTAHFDEFELSLIVAVVTHNFFNTDNHRTPRNAIEAMWRIARQRGLISREWKNEHYTAAIEILVRLGWLLIAIPDNRGNGRARCLCPGVAHPDHEKAQPIKIKAVADFEAGKRDRQPQTGSSSSSRSFLGTPNVNPVREQSPEDHLAAAEELFEQWEMQQSRREASIETELELVKGLLTRSDDDGDDSDPTLARHPRRALPRRGRRQTVEEAAGVERPRTGGGEALLRDRVHGDGEAAGVEVGAGAAAHPAHGQARKPAGRDVADAVLPAGEPAEPGAG